MYLRAHWIPGQAGNDAELDQRFGGHGGGLRDAPQLEEGITTATWVTPQDIPALLASAYSSIPEVFRHKK